MKYRFSLSYDTTKVFLVRLASSLTDCSVFQRTIGLSLINTRVFYEISRGILSLLGQVMRLTHSYSAAVSLPDSEHFRHLLSRAAKNGLSVKQVRTIVTVP